MPRGGVTTRWGVRRGGVDGVGATGCGLVMAAGAGAGTLGRDAGLGATLGGGTGTGVTLGEGAGLGAWTAGVSAGVGATGVGDGRLSSKIVASCLIAAS